MQEVYKNQTHNTIYMCVCTIWMQSNFAPCWLGCFLWMELDECLYKLWRIGILVKDWGEFCGEWNLEQARPTFRNL